jgi:glycosyltransferase involved in cell wall biosynthesis
VTARPLRILHVLTRYLGGGSERDIEAVVSFEIARGHEVHIALGADSEPWQLPPGVELHRIGALRRELRPWFDGLALAELRRLCASRRFDVVHTHQSKAGILGRMAARGHVPVVVHTVHMASFGPGYSRAASLAYTQAERYVGRHTDIVVTVGEELRRRFLAAGVAEAGRYAIVRTPIDIERFARARDASAIERSATLERLRLPSEGPLVLAVGALEARKRHSLTIRALAPLLRAGEVRLVIAGEGPERARLEHIVEEYQVRHRVHLVGRVEDVPALMACASMLVLSSTSEGVPRVVLEALAAGLPVVATDVEGLREIPGAPIDIVARSGVGLRVAVERRAAERNQPLPLDALEEWRPESVERQVASLHERIARVLEQRALLATT